jgi:hypothetical protein
MDDWPAAHGTVKSWLSMGADKRRSTRCLAAAAAECRASDQRGPLILSTDDWLLSQDLSRASARETRDARQSRRTEPCRHGRIRGLLMGQISVKR